ncbi:CLUMA_CG002877, isoform A [Clunio marinus]|uniref:CLUMA_CG002877, isoform A n=1 Tax=Clunio marinus TaxID=568069 RepID=A0A1J1HR86_9DIPT|nr:CLUMA_CG002877, isoform A [Clunio marinus]
MGQKQVSLAFDKSINISPLTKDQLFPKLFQKRHECNKIEERKDAFSLFPHLCYIGLTVEC